MVKDWRAEVVARFEGILSEMDNAAATTGM
jgi:hypothetical protein